MLTSDMSSDSSFLRLTEVHQWLDELFLAHRTALLSLELSQANLLFDRYESNLLAHMKDEEESLIPIYGARISDVPGGAVELFIAEHKKIRGFLAEFRQALGKLRKQKGLALKHKAIELLDREGMSIAAYCNTITPASRTLLTPVWICSPQWKNGRTCWRDVRA